MRRNIAAGNWKMNLTLAETKALSSALEKLDIPENTDVILGVPHPYLAQINDMVSENKGITVAAQNCHEKEKGAYTGEVSTTMLDSIGIRTVILGHSERRAYQNESNALLAEKTKAVLAAGFKVIFCCGESLETREAGKHFDFVSAQLKESLFDLDASAWRNIVIAYEPIWAIGTGVTASSEQAQEIHAHIRKMLADKYGQELAEATSILYGGSVKPANAKELFSNKDIDGGLVGGALLKAADFEQIINSF
jgi:triosephosphate isomerase